jgi:hypothetical protein
MLISEDGERMQWDSNGTSMEFQRLSRAIFGKLIHLIFNPTEVQQISDVQPQIQDGGNSSDTEVLLLCLREVKSLKSKEMLIKRIETLESTIKPMVFTNNGTSSMQMNGRVNQERESLTKSLASMLRDHSL